MVNTRTERLQESVDVLLRTAGGVRLHHDVLVVSNSLSELYIYIGQQACFFGVWGTFIV